MPQTARGARHCKVYNSMLASRRRHLVHCLLVHAGLLLCDAVATTHCRSPHLSEHCSTLLQYTTAAPYCITLLQHTAAHDSTRQHVAARCSTLRLRGGHGGECGRGGEEQRGEDQQSVRNTLQHAAIHCNTRQHTATHGNTRQRTATRCNALQGTATRCNTLRGGGGRQSVWVEHDSWEHEWQRVMCHDMVRLAALGVCVCVNERNCESERERERERMRERERDREREREGACTV